MTHQHKYVFLCLLAIATLLSAASFQPALAQSLGAASSFAVLGGPVACTTSVITGDVGVSPKTAAFANTGCTITGGTPHANDAAAALAQAAFLGVYNTLNPINPMNCGTTISTAAFTGATVGPLVPGVYCFPAAVAFTDTTLTLDGSTNPNGIWIFKVGAALAGSGFQVVLINGAQACNVFWSVGAAVALTTSTLPPLFQGNILAGSTGGAISITGGIVIGRALANGAVALTNTNIQGSCALVDQAKAICSANDNDEHDRDKDRDKDKDHEKDKEHERDHEKERDR